MDQNIKQVILQAQAGSEEAFELLYQNYYHKVYYFVNRQCKNDADAKDVTQETFLEVHRSLRNLNDIDSFYSWLLTIAHSKAVKLFRKNKFQLSGFEGIENSIDYQENRVYMDPKRYAENQSEFEELMQIIDSLTPKQAELIKLSYIDQLKLTEIAKVLGIPLGTVKTRSARAKEELRVKIEKYEAKEHRKLHFNVDMIMPITTMSLLGYFNNLKIGKQLGKFSKAITQNATISLSTLSLVALVVGGGVMAREQMRTSLRSPQNNFAMKPNNAETNSEVESQSTSQTTITPSSSFPEIAYGDQIIKTDQQAYFACMNFAMNNEDMILKKSEEYSQIKPIIETMKQRNSTYYQTLMNEGWIALYEANSKN